MIAEKELELFDAMQKDPELFFEGIGLKLWSGMRMIIDSVWKYKRTSVRAAHGTSKTIAAAGIGLAFQNLFQPSVVISTAPTYRQVDKQLWKEIGTLKTENKELSGILKHLRIDVTPEWYMMGFSTDRAENVEGFHSPNILWILDEAKGMPAWMYDAVEGSMTGGNSKVLEISTTDGADQQCPFRKHHTSERAGWNCIHFSAFDSPFVHPDDFPEYEKHKNKKLYKYGKLKDKAEWDISLSSKIQIATKEWILDRHEGWFVKYPMMWETKVIGDFSTQTEDNVIPLAWVESAINAEVSGEDPCEYGVDVAWKGDDRDVLTKRIGGKVIWQEMWAKTNPMETTGKCIKFYDKDGIFKVDSIGIGAGVFSRLAELGYPVIGIDSRKDAWDNKTYFNIRAEMWFTLRHLFERQFNTGNVISIPNDSELIEDLTGMKYVIHSDGRIIIEKKEKFKSRFGRSPDKGDSLVYAFADLDKFVMEEEG